MDEGLPAAGKDASGPDRRPKRGASRTGTARPARSGQTAGRKPEKRRRLLEAVRSYLEGVLPRDALCLCLPACGCGQADMSPGLPEILILHRGRPLFLALQADCRPLSKLQRRRQADLLLAGAMVVTCHGQDDVVRTLRALELWPTPAG